MLTRHIRSILLQILFLLTSGQFVHIATFDHTCLAVVPGKGVVAERSAQIEHSLSYTSYSRCVPASQMSPASAQHFVYKQQQLMHSRTNTCLAMVGGAVVAEPCGAGAHRWDVLHTEQRK